MIAMSDILTKSQDSPHGCREAGRLTKWMMRWFFREAVGTKVESLSSNFRGISLAGEDLKTATWVAGDKIQIDVGGEVNRTYTPISGSDTGVARVIAFSHGEGPGAVWSSSVRPGDDCQFFGPRRSLDLGQLNDERPFFFGDETSFGLAQALAGTMDGPQYITPLFEMSVHCEPRSLLLQFGFAQASILDSMPADGSVELIEARLRTIGAEIRPGIHLLSGKAASVQRVSRILTFSRGSASSQHVSGPRPIGRPARRERTRAANRLPAIRASSCWHRPPSPDRNTQRRLARRPPMVRAERAGGSDA